MSDQEKTLIAGLSLPKTAALLRVWSIKEAAAKALKITLPRAWKKAEVMKIGRGESIVTLDQELFSARHASADGHLITVMELKH